MSDKRLRELGADCICGDLILDRVTVGHYRNGQFVITPEGAEVLEKDKAKCDQKEPAQAKTPAAAKPARATREKAKDKTEAAAATDAPAGVADAAPATDPVDDLTSGLDEMLGT